ncbi:MAG: hypothetical protein AUJ49_05845 [Desulfovibrionaceae bacterium CG1_02_65_16]|nr:MAG: hypothetical protein AUJ49_05845 [Desulfovibrionaceae bacterium CG1_02_65_16]
MRILCPLCGYGREIDETKIPPRAQMATCPKCAHKFRFRVVDDLDAETPASLAPKVATGFGAQPGGAPGGLPGGQDLSAAPPDPMAAQRAAASQAWRRLQGAAGKPGQPDTSAPGQSATPASPSASSEPLGPTPLNAPVQTDPSALPGGAPVGGMPVGALNAPAAASPVPFEDLPRHGFFPGLWGTIRMVLIAPAPFFRVMPTHGGMAKPLVFHLLLAEFMVVCQYLWSLAGIGATAEYLGSPEVMDMGLGLAQAAPIMLFIVYPLLLVMRLMLMTGIIHLLLKLIRSGASGGEATFRVLCYSAAPLILGVIPGVGPLIGGVWSIGLTVIGLKEAHRTRFSASMFAVLVPILMMLAAIIGLLQGMSKG